MKCFIVVVVLCSAIGLSHQQLSREQIDEMTLELLKECAKTEGAPPADVEVIQNRQMPTNRMQKCIHACLGETVGLLENRKVNIEGSVELAVTAFGPDDPKVKIARAIATECADITDPDRCEAAFKIGECSMTVGKKHGVNFNEML